MFSRAAAAVLTAAMLFASVWSAPTFAHNVTTYVASLTAASDLVFYSSGNLYVSGNTIVSKVGPGGGPVTTYASGFQSAYGLAFGPNGHVYVAERFSGRIYDVASDGSKTIFASGLTDPVFIKFNVAGDLFVGEWAPRNLKRVSPAGVVSMYAANLSPVTQEVGDFWIMPSGEIQLGAGPDIKRIGVGGSPIVTVASGLGGVVGMRRNDDGSFIVSKGAAHVVFYVSPSGVGSIMHGPGLGCIDGPIAAANFSQPDAMTTRNGVLYIADRACNRVRSIDRSGATATTPATWGRIKTIYR